MKRLGFTSSETTGIVPKRGPIITVPTIIMEGDAKARHTPSLVHTPANSLENMSTKPSQAALGIICLKSRRRLLPKLLLTLMAAHSCSSPVQVAVLKYQESRLRLVVSSTPAHFQEQASRAVRGHNELIR
jgi:hypothetical protein